MIKIKIKALSVNECWQGQRFKTKAYKDYEKQVLLILPPLCVPDGKLRLYIEIGTYSKLLDIDNPVKPFVDILQKKYEFNDRNIYDLHIAKVLVDKSCEYIKFNIRNEKDDIHKTTNN